MLTVPLYSQVLAPCIDSPLCQEQLIEACKMVAAAVEKIVLAAQAACGDDDALRDLGAAATAVTEALNSLIQQIKEGVEIGEGSECNDLVAWITVIYVGYSLYTHTHTHTHTHSASHTHSVSLSHTHTHTHSVSHTHTVTHTHTHSATLKHTVTHTHTHSTTLTHSHTHTPSGAYDDAVEAILLATERLFASIGNAQEMVQQAMNLAKASAVLVNAIKLEAENETDPDARRRLLDAARSLADATSKMVMAAKGSARNPTDEASQEALRKAAEHLRAVVNAAASSALKKKAIKKLEIAAKQTAAVATQCIAAAQGAGASNRNEASQMQLINHCKAVAEQVSSLVQAIRLSMANQDSPSAQLGLINSSQAMIPVSIG